MTRSSAPRSPAVARRRLATTVRRQQILEAAIGLFSQRGFKGTTTREIATAAGVNEALIFRHFARKQDLYAAILREGAHHGDTTQWLPELHALADCGDDRRLLTTLFGRLIAQHDQAHDFLRLMLYSALEDHSLTQMFFREQVEPLQDFLAAYVAQRRREGVFRAIDTDGAVRSILALPTHHVLVTRVLRSDTWFADDQTAAEVFADVVLCGLRAPVQEVGIPGRAWRPLENAIDDDEPA